MIYLGSDHRGFELKEQLKKRLVDEGLEITDLGNDHLDPNDDYVDFAQKVASAVQNDEKNRGILLCGSGVGVDMVANKISGIRSSLVFDVTRAKQSREHEDANVLSLAADVLDPETVWEIVKTFLETSFSQDVKHIRRLQKLSALEK
ncbi:RpiB/LacA/LacB family sugar-phosphate isomerase [Candidatus Daviesbacteria bacterium]|nr:RpiB/LacA/LacB family sugar-phosphate isomerase [Candidatus Daviesbacteria bacterium]